MSDNNSNHQDPATPIIEITFNGWDVEEIADEFGIDHALAYERANEWAKSMRDTAVERINQTLASVIEHGQP